MGPDPERAIKYLEDPMAEVLIKSELKEGDTIHVGFSSAKSEIKFRIIKNVGPDAPVDNPAQAS